jgi:arginine-tRNA-protein transferase
VLRGNTDVDVQVAPPEIDAERVALYNKHLFERGLSTNGEPITIEQYGEWLVQSGIETLEFSYRVQGALVGIGLVDLGAQDGSSVYFYFDPSQGKRSLGTFSVLKELEWLKQRDARFHYLGFYNRDCQPLRYKAGFGPHELLLHKAGRSDWGYRPKEPASSSP